MCEADAQIEEFLAEVGRKIENRERLRIEVSEQGFRARARRELKRCARLTRR